MIAAVYRCLYGEDFIQESVRSILPHVDRIFVVLADRPWGSSAGVCYRGEWVSWPKRFDGLRERVLDLREPSVEVVDDWYSTPVGQYEHIVNDVLLPKYQIDEILLMEPDWVFSAEQATLAFAEWKEVPDVAASTHQVELWKTASWRVPEREGRASPMFYRNFDRFRSIDGPTLLSAYAHNLGFCYSEATMRWKHLTAMAFASEIEDCLPRQGWLEDVWRRWHPGMRDLEISEGLGHRIPEAEPYDELLVPAEARVAIDRARSRDACVSAEF